jgi:hypothetical protein
MSTCTCIIAIGNVDLDNIWTKEDGGEVVMRMMLKTTGDWMRCLWNTDRPLTAGAVLMLVAFVFALAGLVVDPRTITGMPAWMKPAKFAISTAIFMLTLAWIFTYLPARVKLRRIVGRATAALLVLEVAIVSVQAWRGTTSHFNAGTVLDGTLFTVMGIAIAVQTALSVAVVIALWRQPFLDRPLGWALRLGLTISIIGASTGGLMVGPTRAQLAEARVTHRLPIAGAHTVGAPDGGPGLAGVGWSREHGDLRVPHFLGLHAMQLLPLFVLVATRRGLPEARRVHLTFVIAASYFSLFVILLWQALRAQSFVQPDALTLGAMVAWAITTIVATWAIASRPQAAPSRAMVY